MKRLRRRTGVFGYFHGEALDAAPWGFEEWRILQDVSGGRTMNAYCELEFDGLHVAREVVQSVSPTFQPTEAFVRLWVDRAHQGSALFRFDGDRVLCESETRSGGRLSQTVELSPPVRGFGTHALQADAWIAACYDLSRGVGRQAFRRNPLSSSHHFGATGPWVHLSDTGLEYCGDEDVTVRAGAFRCHRFRFVNATNGHPPYDIWTTSDGDFVFVRGVVEGYMAARFELTELTDGLF